MFGLHPLTASNQPLSDRKFSKKFKAQHRHDVSRHRAFARLTSEKVSQGGRTAHPLNHQYNASLSKSST